MSESNSGTRIQDPEVAAKEAWEVHDRAEGYMGLGETQPTAKQLDAAQKGYDDEKGKLEEVQREIDKIKERLPAYEQTADAMQDLTEHITGKKFD